MEYRFLSIEDYAKVVELWKNAGLKFKPNGRDSEKSITEQMIKQPNMFLGAFDGKKLVGIALLTDDGRKGWINRLAVDPAYRRKGIAKELIKKAEELFRSRGIYLFAALIEEWNIPSQTLFQDMGYKKHSDIYYFSKRDFDEY
ncbi:MAG: GNAT family N-acetyltransferase [Thermoplasmata archaeon]|nr:GNAT family N-acetyltransferase [Thermoplasmata archaeon]